MSTVSNNILSDITIYSKYAKHLKNKNRREIWEEIVSRNKEMHLQKYPELKEIIEDSYKLVYSKSVLPSMRSLQFGGRPIELSPNRMFNCAYLPIDHIDAFSETMFLLLGGTGVGYSVQKSHVAELPIIKGPIDRNRRFVVGDSIEGWADAIKVLMSSYMLGKSRVNFDFSDIRPKGSLLITSGGKAPGPKPLHDCIHNVRNILDEAIGRKLKTIEVHDIICHIADAVLAGGIRRAALISLFSHDDLDMMSSKHGEWYELNPQRGRANNSAILKRDETSEEKFRDIWDKIYLSKCGEPGIYWTNDLDWGTNPCVEIALNPNQFCNVTDVNCSDIKDQEDFNKRVRCAAILGTLQAGYTNFHYLRDIWKETTEKEALIGVGLTGIGSGRLEKLDLEQASKIVVETNKEIAKLININPAARTTTIKPSGTSSLVVGSSSGVHGWHGEYYLRRMRLGKNEPLCEYITKNHPNLIEDEYFRPHEQSVISIPQKAPEGSIMRSESCLSLLERVKRFNIDWVHAGHISGSNTHNVSCTISLKEEDWKEVGDWMWNNKEFYNGISVLPYDGGTYKQAPFEEISEEMFYVLEKDLIGIDLSKVSEEDDNTNLSGELACAGGACEIN